MTFRPMVEIESIDSDFTKPHDLENVVQQLHRVIDRVKSGEYDMLQGDLIGYNYDTAKVDIINTNLKGSKWEGAMQSTLSVESINCGSLPVSMIVHDTLLDATRIMAMPEIDDEGETIGYVITKGYEEFAQTIITLGLKDEVGLANVEESQ